MIDKALLLEYQLGRLERPTSLALRTYREAIYGVRKSESKVGGSARNLLDDEKDLLVLQQTMDEDLLSQAIRKYWPFSGPVSKHYYGQPLDLSAHIVNRVFSTTIKHGRSRNDH